MRQYCCLIVCSTVIFAVLISNVSSQGYYNVVGPRVIRPKSEYHCAVSVQAASEPTTVTALLQGISFNGTPFFSQDQVVVLPYSSKICSLQVGELEDGEYELQVRGTGGVDFSTGYPLQYVQKSYTVFIQTDKQVYRPGKDILFRAIVLNSQLKPAAEVRNELLNIHITDGSGNKVKEWRRVEAIRGVFTGELKLSDQPVLGNWNISVTVHGQTYHKTIEVAEYILPKFIVDVESPKHITFKENIIRAKIDTRYNYGDKVKGEATVTVFPTIYSGVIQPIFQNPVRKVFDIDGSASVEFDIERDLGLNDEYERIVVVDVAIEEHLTGRRQNNSVEVHIHKYDYHMELVKSADYFKPGLKYTAYVQVTNNDGTRINTNNREVIVRHWYSRVDEVHEENRHELNENGFLKLEFITPRNVTNSTALRLQVEFRDLKEISTPIPAAVSYSDNFLQATLETDRPVINQDVNIVVNSTQSMRSLNYVLIGRGDVLITNTFHVDNRKQFKFHFTATHAMVPVCHLIVYYVRSDGELIGDALDIEVDGLLQNFVDVQVNTLESEPNLDVEFTVRAQQNSYIGLMAVDENVSKLKSGYDLSLDYIAEELKMYDPAQGTPYPHLARTKSKISWYPGASNPHSAIFESGADIATNTHINRMKPTLEDIYLRPVFYGSSTIKPDRGLVLPIHAVTRPPLAGPYAFSRIPRPVWNKPKVFLLEDIADTWLFSNFSTYEGKSSIRRMLPNTLTTWSITGFSLDPLHGLGISTAPKLLKVSKSLAVMLDLPYSIQRGEILSVPVVVKNNMNEEVVADVTLHNSENRFEFVASSEDNNVKRVELYRRKRVKVGKNAESTVSFLITGSKIGSIPIKVTATTPKNQDMTETELLVVPGGEKEYYTKSVLLDLRNNPNAKRSINFTIPKNAVTGSENIEVSAVGTFLAAAMVHLDSVIRLPTDCGEQNLVHLMSNLIVLHYLKTTNQLTPAVQNQAVVNLETGYQKQLNYRRKDGSYSIFERKDSVGSVWLTAYTALALKQARNYIFVDEDLIESALNWLANIQGKNGSFYETGSIIHSELQNNSGNSLALTAFVVMAIQESSERNNPILTNVINKGLDYIARNIDDNESTYSLALCSYALQITGHASTKSAFNLLDNRGKSKDNMKWWAKDTPSNEVKNPWHNRPRSIDIEMTSYALMTFIEANLLEDALPVLDWLLNQQNNLGGFTSSHDTVVGLQALYKIVTRLASPVNMQIEYEYGKEGSGKFSLNRNNIMILQSMKILDKTTREVNITAQGNGLAVFKVSYQYNSNVTGPWPMFTLDPQVDKNSNNHHLQISICISFVSENLTHTNSSNMAVMEVNLPSGFTADTDALPSLELSENVQKVETSNKLTKVLLYFNNLTRIEYCPTISAYRTYKVARQRPVAVVLYDYYDTSRRARVFYKGTVTHLCDVCEDADCESICKAESKAREGRERQIGDGGGAAIPQISITFYAIVFGIVKLNW
ncbi:unnamed protein product [Phyllotreta striolata]|uniref:TEP1-F n=1 Tax=Phyllotreta striolata TaxID=444603 RepID=A0A9N9XLR1_PHYSR|nr:unnamed protein product [Phyllotreta striolata]